MRKKVLYISGQRYNELTLLTFSHTANKKIYWNCECSCGTKKVIEANKVRRGGTKSCGCLSTRNITEESVRLIAAKEIFSRRYNDGDLTFDDFYEMSQEKCHYCGAAPSNKAHVVYNIDGSLRNISKKNSIYLKFPNAFFLYNGLDRKSSKIKEHNKDNVVSCCAQCNNTKRHIEYNDFLNMIKKIYNNLELDGHQ